MIYEKSALFSCRQALIREGLERDEAVKLLRRAREHALDTLATQVPVADWDGWLDATEKFLDQYDGSINMPFSGSMERKD